MPAFVRTDPRAEDPANPHHGRRSWLMVLSSGGSRRGFDWQGHAIMKADRSRG
jgi:hypothetical protein